MQFYAFKYNVALQITGCTLGIMVIVIGNGGSNLSSNFGWGDSHFTFY